MEFNKITSERIQEIYLECRKEIVNLRKNGMDEGPAKEKAFYAVYYKHKDELNGAGINDAGLLKLMDICNVFWCSRGEETKKDLMCEFKEIYPNEDVKKFDEKFL